MQERLPFTLSSACNGCDPELHFFFFTCRQVVITDQPNPGTSQLESLAFVYLLLR